MTLTVGVQYFNARIGACLRSPWLRFARVSGNDTIFIILNHKSLLAACYALFLREWSLFRGRIGPLPSWSHTKKNVSVKVGHPFFKMVKSGSHIVRYFLMGGFYPEPFLKIVHQTPLPKFKAFLPNDTSIY